jgi:hypothetical protein
LRETKSLPVTDTNLIKDNDVAHYFKSQKWYLVDANYKGSLTDLESKNVDMITSFEQSDRARHMTFLTVYNPGINNAFSMVKGTWLFGGTPYNFLISLYSIADFALRV